MRGLAALMRRQTRAAYEEDVEVPTGPFKPDFSGRWAATLRHAPGVTDGVTADTVKWAYGAGAGIPGVPERARARWAAGRLRLRRPRAPCRSAAA